MTTALFLLRCLEIGLSVKDLDLLSIGMVIDIWTESNNDRATDGKQGGDTVREATQEDFNRF